MLELPGVAAVSVQVWVEVTFAVVIVAVPEVAPAAMLRLVGPVTAPLFELRAIVKPPTGAAELIVTVAAVLTEP